jgi:hypothetical protein
LTGIAELRTKAGQLEGIDPQNATYSLEVIDPDGDASEYTGHPHYPVFTNSDAGGRGLCQVVSSIMPDFVSATNVTIPSHSIPSSNTVTYTSSVLTSKDSGVTTIQAFYDNYSGTATIQGSTLNDTDWYDINTSTYLETTASDGYTVTGFHPYLRLSFTSTQGNVTQILAR